MKNNTTSYYYNWFKIKPFRFVLFLLVLVLFSCQKDNVEVEVYDIIIVCGQSNTHYGLGQDSVLDAPHEKIMQLGRKGDNDLKIIQATEPLEHYTRVPNHIGFALTFAKHYVGSYLAKKEKLLIIPAGHIGSGFMKNDWNEGDMLFEDVVSRVTYVLTEYPKSHLSGILWHQGESDIVNEDYQMQLDSFISAIRMKIHQPELPFVLGGMVPEWVQLSNKKIKTQKIIEQTPDRIPNTAYANPSFPFEIKVTDKLQNIIHYDAVGLRELGRRYFDAFTTLK